MTNKILHATLWMSAVMMSADDALCAQDNIGVNGLLSAPRPVSLERCTPPDYTAAAARAEAVGTVVITYALALDSKLAWATIEESSGTTREHKMLDRIAIAALTECIGESKVQDREKYPITGRVAAKFDLPRTTWIAQPAVTTSEEDRATMRRILAEATLQRDAQEAARRADEKRRRDNGIAEYRRLYLLISTLDGIEIFEKFYRDDDPENLIAKLQPRKANLLLERYRQEYQEASSSVSLQLFISNYKDNDPDGLVPTAQQRLALLKKSEAEAQARKSKSEQAAAVANRLASLEAQILQCRRTIEVATTVIGREREIGRVSGYENATLLHAAGRDIVDCRKRIQGLYATYRSSGGTKELEKLH